MTTAWDQAYNILDCLFDMPQPRMEKCKALFEYAQSTHEGRIVELGTYVGCGAIAMALGAPEGTKVFTIDDYAQRKGWAKEPYDSDNEAVFHANVDKAGVDVTLVKKPVQEAVKDWHHPIGLLHWDLGMFSGMIRDFWNWEPLLIKGGVLAMHDTFERQLGSFEIEEEAVKTRRFRAPVHVGGGIWGFEKRPSVVFCAGMSRSGGTLQYLITREILERAGIGRGIGHGNQFQYQKDSRDVLIIKKEQAPTWAVDMVLEGQADVVGIFRDPRDVAASLVEFREGEKEFKGFNVSDWRKDIALAINWQKEWEKLPDVYMTRYENVRGRWGMMAMDIAGHLGLKLTLTEAENIADTWSIPRTLERIDEIKNDGLWFAREWLLTRVHIGRGKGKVNRWKTDLTPEDTAWVEGLAGKEWMAVHGYRLSGNA